MAGPLPPEAYKEKHGERGDHVALLFLEGNLLHRRFIQGCRILEILSNELLYGCCKITAKFWPFVAYAGGYGAMAAGQVLDKGLQPELASQLLDEMEGVFLASNQDACLTQEPCPPVHITSQSAN